MMFTMILVFVSIIMLILGQDVSTSVVVNGQSGTCLKSRNHLPRPAKNVPLDGLCAPWSGNTCCSRETSIQAHRIPDQYGFNITHCGHGSISAACHDYFIRDICYTNCDPYAKPWMVGDNVAGQERIMQAPLCQSDCIEWWNRCSENSLTCVRNWRKHFVWHQESTETIRTNFCPPGTKCQLFKDIYKDANDFCQTVWDDSWKVVEDTEKCVSIEFRGAEMNPNEMVEKYYAQEEFGNFYRFDWITIILTVIGIFIICFFIYKLINIYRNVQFSR